jgi:DNA ligase-1
MSRSGTPDVHFYVFDIFGLEEPFTSRIALLLEIVENLKNPNIHYVEQIPIFTPEELIEYEYGVLSQGHEGVMLRSWDGPYKHGRSTVKEGWLLKLKRFEDGEAKVLDIQEMMHNTNIQTKDAFGNSTRNLKLEGLVGSGVLGALTVEDCKTGVQFDIGTGFTAKERKELFQQSIVGRIVKYKHFPVGGYEKPRFPTFLGFRDIIDI